MAAKPVPILTRTAPQRSRLLARIHRRYATVVEEVRIGRLLFDFTRVEDPNRVLDEVAAEADRAQPSAGQAASANLLGLPYWAEIWDSSYGVAHYLTQILQASSAPRPLRVLDLGCGMGFTGMVSAAMGADVLLGDLMPPALLFARLNCLKYSTSCRTRRLNWQVDRLDQTFDLIVGADILYEKSQWDYLEPFWRAHLAPEGTVLLGEPGRITGDLFPAWIEARRWQVERFEEPVVTRSRPIRLLRIRPL